jgi:hypothetical protein
MVQLKNNRQDRLRATYPSARYPVLFHKASRLIGILCVLFVILLLSGCGGGSGASSSMGVTTAPVTPTPISVTPTPTPPPAPAQYDVFAAISAVSADYNGWSRGSLDLSHGSASRTVAGGQDTIDVQFSDLGVETPIHFKFVKSGTIQAGDVLSFAPAADGAAAATSEYTENFNAVQRWKADAGSAQVDSISSSGVYTISLKGVHYTADTTTPAQGAFELNGMGAVVFAPASSQGASSAIPGEGGRMRSRPPEMRSVADSLSRRKLSTMV